MNDRVISSRYAKVLFDLDCMKGILEKRLEDFESMINIFNYHPQLVKFLKKPQVALKEKKKVLQDSFKGRFDQTFIDFLSYLVQKKRLVQLNYIGNEYRFLVNKYLDRWDVDIVTAVPLDKDSEVKLVENLEKRFHKKINLNKRINPKMIGGAILVISNEMVDWSVIGRLRKLKENLIAT